MIRCTSSNHRDPGSCPIGRPRSCQRAASGVGPAGARQAWSPVVEGRCTRRAKQRALSGSAYPPERNGKAVTIPLHRLTQARTHAHTHAHTHTRSPLNLGNCLEPTAVFLPPHVGNHLLHDACPVLSKHQAVRTSPLPAWARTIRSATSGAAPEPLQPQPKEGKDRIG